MRHLFPRPVPRLCLLRHGLLIFARMPLCLPRAPRDDFRAIDFSMTARLFYSVRYGTAGNDAKIFHGTISSPRYADDNAAADAAMIIRRACALERRCLRSALAMMP